MPLFGSDQLGDLPYIGSGSLSLQSGGDLLYLQIRISSFGIHFMYSEHCWSDFERI